jgi:hypothetical protein
MSTKKVGRGKRAKQPYRKPRLTVHGDVRQLTRGGGGSKQDGQGKPNTRLSGQPA